MPPNAQIPRWKVVLRYAAFSAFSLLFALFLTFPYDALRQRVQNEADAAGLYVKMGGLGPGLGITATDVRISQKATGAEEKTPEALVIRKISVLPSLYPLGVWVRASVLGGSASAHVGGVSDLVVHFDMDELDLSQGNLKGFSGVDLTGKLSGRVELSIPRITVGGAKIAEPDLGQASGFFRLELTNVTVNGGTVQVAIPMYGPEPTPIDLPKVVLGDIEGKMKVVKGQGTLESFTAKGQGLEVKGSGTLKLAKRLSYAEPNLEVRLKADPDFVKSLGIYGTGLAMIPSDPKDPNWRLGKLTGYLGRPNFR
ncbi:MAG: type II secretion system protein GspN [Myxococcota bacterium]